MTQIDADLNVTPDPDPEVRQRWYAMGLGLQYQPVYTYAQAWVGSMGRNKYIKPIYAALQDSGQHDLGVQWNNANIDFYCAITETAIMGILFPSPTVEDVADFGKFKFKSSLKHRGDLWRREAKPPMRHFRSRD